MADQPLLPSIPDLASRSDRKESQRARIFRALAELVGEDGWSAITVSRIAVRAGVSTRAFYEHFADKETCLIEAYDAMIDTAISHVSAPGVDGDAWRRRLASTLERWLGLLAEHPNFTRIYAIEIWSASPATQQRARAGTRVLVDVLRSANRAACAEDPSVDQLDDDELQMLAGGVHRLAVLATIDGRIDQLREAVPAVLRVTSAAVSRRSD
jgi:AcrR family transcriptional regulator